MHDHSPATLSRARRLRRDMSLPEVLLWQILRTKPMGLKFRNQHPVDDYVADFYCHSAKTLIEIDGKSHDMGDQPEFDEERDARLNSLGYQVVRIPATDVLKCPTTVAEQLVALCAEPKGGSA
jgi:very-short-patch-repair endonuclease